MTEQPTPSRRAGLRDEIAEALYAHDHPGWQRGFRACSVVTLAALDEPAPGPAATQTTEHLYLSTACRHAREPNREDLHTYCQSNTGLGGTKKPSRCKWCDALCQCPCHNPQEQP